MEHRLWGMLVAHIQSVPGRYLAAKANAAFGMPFMNHLPLGFDEETAEQLSPEAIVAADIQLANEFLLPLRGILALSVPLPGHPAGTESIEAFESYQPHADKWQLQLASGNVANIGTVAIADVIHLRNDQ